MEIKELRKFAEAATPGPWIVQHPHAGRRGFEVASSGGRNQVCQDVGSANANFIAIANPAATLELIDTIESLQRERDALREALEWVVADYEGMCRQEYPPSANWKKRIVKAKSAIKFSGGPAQ